MNANRKDRLETREHPLDTDRSISAARGFQVTRTAGMCEHAAGNVASLTSDCSGIDKLCVEESHPASGTLMQARTLDGSYPADVPVEDRLFAPIRALLQGVFDKTRAGHCFRIGFREQFPEQPVKAQVRNITNISPGEVRAIHVTSLHNRGETGSWPAKMSHTLPTSASMRGFHRGLAQACVLLLITACGTTPVRDPVAVALPDDFSGNGASHLPQHWWKSFNDPVLDHLIDGALAQNFSLQSVWSRLDQAQALERISRAALYPAVDAEGSAGRSWSHNSRGSTASNYSTGAMASYELDLWGRIDSSSKAATLDRQASEAELMAAAISLSAEVASTWYQLVEQYGQQALVTRQLETNTRVLELLTLRFRRGKVGATDVLQQRQLAESNRGELANIQALIGVLEHRLAILLGATPDRRVAEPQDELISLPPLPATGIPAELVQRRPDLRLGFYTLQAADQRTAAAVADRFPRINLLGSTDSTSSDVDDLFNNWLSNLTGNLVAPVIDGGRRRAEVDRTRAVAEQSLSDYRQQLIDALGEVEDALLREEQQYAFIDSLEKQLALSRQVIGRVRDSYLYGAVDYLRVLDVLITDQNLERSRLIAQRELIDNRIALCRALAGGWTLERPLPAGVGTRITRVEPE